MVVDRKISETVESFFKNIVGMKEAKRSFQLVLDAVEFERIRKDKGYDEPIVTNLNFIICGGRGVGKTRLAHILADFFNNRILEKKYDILSFMSRTLMDSKVETVLLKMRDQNNKIVILENINEYLEDTDIRDDIRQNTVLSISEIMKDKGKDIIFIITGSNSGIESLKYYDPTLENYVFDTVNIDNYTPDELWQILQIMSEENQLHVDETCSSLVKNKFSAQSLVAGFLNGTIVERYKNESAKRLASNYFKKRQEQDQDQTNDDIELSRIDAEAIPFKDTSERLQKRLDELDGLIGLELVKQKVRDQLAMLKVALRNERMGLGKRRDQTLHMVFKGNPGTGKTTVAQILGDIYCEMGLLPAGDQGVKVVSRAEMVGRYVGETAQIVKKICENADGGVLFIDEAYSLINSDQDSFGREAVDTLIQEMENLRNSMMVILAGYNKEMDEFLKTNPGFRSRIPESNFLDFEDYTSGQMVEIFKAMVNNDGYRMPMGISDDKIKALVETRSKKSSFGNARGVRNLVQDVEDELDKRVAENDEMADRDASVRRLTKFERKAITEENITAVFGKKIEGEKTVEELLDILKGMEGLHSVKQQVENIVRSVEYADILKARGIEPESRTKTMHLIFSGNPGTGKSTIAGMLGEIYIKLGILKKNTFILVKREDLVGQYQGHTAAQVASKVAEADGGILFIDEAYQLYIDERDTFGMEAIGTLLSLAEEKRDSLMIVLAGYKDDMDRFLTTNPGLKSRFPKAIEFEDYSIDELVNIFKYMCENEKMHLEDGVIEMVKEVIGKRRSVNPKEFGNARGVRNIVDEIIMRQNSRIASDKDNIDSYSEEELFTIKKGDVIND